MIYQIKISKQTNLSAKVKILLESPNGLNKKKKKKRNKSYLKIIDNTQIYLDFLDFLANAKCKFYLVSMIVH